jgi:hypothetical protein
MRNLNVLGYSLFFVLPWLAILAGIVSLLIPRRTPARHAPDVQMPSRAA